MAGDSILFAELTREAIGERAPRSLAILPVGATEQHGPHLPTGTDHLAVEAVVHLAAVQASRSIPIIVAPTLPFGSSPHHLPFGGTLSLSSPTYLQVLTDVLESLIGAGFRKILIVNGHGGNQELIRVAVRDLALKHPVVLGAAAYWDIARDVLAKTDLGRAGQIPGHAGTFESSLMLALHPETGEDERPIRNQAEIPTPRGLAPIRREAHGYWQSIDGFTDNAAAASAELGQELLAQIIDAVAAAFVEFAESE